MPQFTTHQLDVFINAYGIFKNDPRVRRSHQRDLHHLNGVLQYMDTHYDDDNYNMTQLLQNGSRKVYIGSDGKQGFLDFTMNGFQRLEEGFVYCVDDIKQIANDSRLNREPMMKAYLGYVKMIAERGLSNHQDRNAYASDVVYNTVNAMYGMFSRIPTQAEMEQLRLTNPEAYDHGIRIMNYISAYTAFNDPALLMNYEKADQVDRQALHAERLRRLEALEQATEDFSKIPVNKVFVFFDAIGCKNPDYFVRSVESDGFDNKKHNAEAGLKQLQNYKRLMQQGVTLEEARLLSDVSNFTKYIPSDFFLDDMKIEFLPEPSKSKWRRAEEVGKLAREKFENGFNSEREKNELFRTIAEAFEDLDRTIRTDQPNFAAMNLSELERGRTIGSYNSFRQILQNELDNKESVLHRAIDMKNRVISTEITDRWANRTELTPAVLMLKSAGNAYLGGKDGQEYKDFMAMKKALNMLASFYKENEQDEQSRLALGEQGRIAAEKAEAYLQGIFDHAQALQAQDPRRLEVTKLRVIGTLNVLHVLNPEKADALRERTDALFGRKLSWNELKTASKTSMDRRPNYNRYYELHTGEHIQDLPDRRLVEYAAKAASALLYMDEPGKKFSVDVPRKHAENLLKHPDFRAALKAAGPAKIREVLASGDPTALVKLTTGGASRYAISQEAKAKFRVIAGNMRTEGRPAEYAKLKEALMAEPIKSSEKVFDAVEALVKGRKSVKNDPEREMIVRTALDALAVAAASGDAVAKARAEMLTDRFNQVRETQPGDRDYVNLSDYGHVNLPEAPEQNLQQEGVNHQNA